MCNRQAIRHPSRLAVLQAQAARARRVANQRHARALCIAAWAAAAVMWATYTIPALIGA